MKTINPKDIQTLGTMLGQTHVAVTIMVDKVHGLFGKNRPDFSDEDLKQVKKDVLDAAIIAAGFKGTRSGDKSNPDSREYNTIHKRVSRLFMRVMTIAYPAPKGESKVKKITAKGWASATTAKRIAFIKSLLKEMLEDEKVVPSDGQREQIVAALAATSK